MEDIKIQKIEIYSSKDYVDDQEIFDERKNEVENILKENNIEYALEITEKEAEGSTSKFPKTLYTLNLVIKQDDANKVKSLLDDLYKYDYKFIFDEEPSEEPEEPVQEVYSTKEETNRSLKEKLKDLDVIGKCILGFLTIIYAFLIIFEIVLINDSGLHKGIIIAMIIETFLYYKAMKVVINRKVVE